MSLLQVPKGRAVCYCVTIRDTAGTAITPQSGDIVRARIQACGTVYLEVDSTAATSGGSSVTKGNPTEVSFSDDDLDTIEPGNYTLCIDYFDAADSQWKHVDDHVMSIQAP